MIIYWGLPKPRFTVRTINRFDHFYERNPLLTFTKNPLVPRVYALPLVFKSTNDSVGGLC